MVRDMRHGIGQGVESDGCDVGSGYEGEAPGACGGDYGGLVPDCEEVVLF